MYTVLIQPKNTMDTFNQFYPLFADMIEKDKVGICQWVESGNSVETAMPELYDLVERKNKWRAVIVRTEFEDEDERYPTDLTNPYDYLENAGRERLTIENGQVVDSDVPVIRLAHMLGGIPSPEPHFEAVTIFSENGEDKMPRVVYKPVLGEEYVNEEKAAYRRWCDENTFQGAAPLEIILVTVRKASLAKDDLAMVSAAWKGCTEAESSEFWKRNLYPHNCRFLVYDMEQRGSLQRQNDLFRFWISLRLIVENPTDPNVLQAHRLYRMNAILDQETLQEDFQYTINKLNVARYQLAKSLKHDEEELEHTEEKLPDYEMEVPIAFQFPRTTDFTLDTKNYLLTGGVGSSDFGVWKNYSEAANREFRLLLHSTERTLDQTAERIRGRCQYSEVEVRPLNGYQEEDIDAALQQVYGEILSERENLPDGMTRIEDKIDKADKAVYDQLLQRMNGKQVLGICLMSIVLMLLAFLPGVADAESWKVLALQGVFSVVILLVTVLLVLTRQRNRLVMAMKNFQLVLQSGLRELSIHAINYSDFFSGIATHIRGSSYLNLMRNKREKRDSTYYFKQNHLKKIEVMLSRLNLWSMALHVKVDMTSVDAIDLADEEAADGIDFDQLYALSSAGGSRLSQVPLNQTGICIDSPFRFVECIQIEREEIYDNV